MVKVIGVRFRTAGKVYFFDPGQLEIKRGEHVIVETARGIEYGTVVSPVTELPEEKITQPLKGVLRIATQRDDEQERQNKEKEREAFRICLEKIHKHELDMKLIDAEYTFDNNKVLFYFTADGRIDFRELVKDLAAVFRTRIELRQIGVRDETKILGGIGICGRPLCCHTYLSEFAPVSIKMAKEQNLSLNPTKISGVCGRLMCCLKNEEETYEELNRRLPGVGDAVTIGDDLRGEVQSVNVLRQTVKVLVEIGDEKELKEYRVDELQFVKKRHKNNKNDKRLADQEEKELEQLEELEKLDDLNRLEESEKPVKNERKNHSHGNRNRQELKQKEDRSDRQDQPGRPEQTDKPERGRRQGRGQRRDRADRSEHADKPEHADRPESSDRPERPRRNRSDRRNRHHRSEKREDESKGADN